MENKIKKVFVFIFAFILLFFMIITLSNSEKYSQVERRKLVTFPEINLQSILSKNYYETLTNAFSDQLALRKYLVKGYFLFNFQRYYGDAVKGKNNQLYSPSEVIPNSNYYKNLEKVLKKVNEVAESTNAKFIFLSIPRKDAYMRTDLPNNYNSSYNIYQKQVSIAKEVLNDSIIFIDAYEIFEQNGIYKCYYSNDHHITPRCAYLLLNEINKNTGISTYSLDDTFDIKQTIVNGAYNRQLGQTVKSNPEDLYVVPKFRISYTRYENNKLSNKQVFGKGHSYEDAYMEGDMAYTKIITSIKNNKRIMYVGSSYTNILEAFSLPSYELVTSIDYRHNKSGKSINDYVNENSIDYIVFVPSQSNNAFSIQQIKLHLGY